MIDKIRILKLLPLLLVAVLAMALLAACGGDDESTAAKPTIRFGDNQYESLWINDAIAAFIIENGYGYPTEEVPLTTQLTQVALAQGDVDIWIELWAEYFPDWLAEETAAGNVIDLDEVVMFEGPGFWLIPKKLAEEHNIVTVEDMKRPEVVALFPDLEDSSKGLMTNCPIGSQCSKINPAKLRAYGLDEYYNTAEPGTQGAYDAIFAAAMKKGDPIFAYYWAPTSIVGKFIDDLYILEEPAYTDACWDEVVKGKEDETYTPKEACAYRTSQVTKAIHKDLVTKAPDVVEFLRKMQIGSDPLSRTAAWAVDNDVTDWNEAAVYFLQNFEDRWTTWVPADIAADVKKALAEETS